MKSRFSAKTKNRDILLSAAIQELYSTMIRPPLAFIRSASSGSSGLWSLLSAYECTAKENNAKRKFQSSRPTKIKILTVDKMPHYNCARVS